MRPEAMEMSDWVAWKPLPCGSFQGSKNDQALETVGLRRR